MQMKTRSTTRAEAARLQVSTRSQVRALMAPPASKITLWDKSEAGYVKPRRGVRHANAQMLSQGAGRRQTKQNHAACDPDLLTSDNEIGARNLVPLCPRPTLAAYELEGEVAREARKAPQRSSRARKAGKSGKMQTFSALPAVTPWTTLTMLSEDQPSQGTLGLVERTSSGEGFSASVGKRRAQKQGSKKTIKQKVQNHYIQKSIGQIGDSHSTVSGLYSFGGCALLPASMPLLQDVELGTNSVASRYTQPPQTTLTSQIVPQSSRAMVGKSSPAKINKIDRSQLELPSQQAWNQVIACHQVESNADFNREKAVLPQLTCFRKGFGSSEILKPTKQVKARPVLLRKQVMALKSASDPKRKLNFDLYREEQLPWSAWTRNSSMAGPLRALENDYDSDSDQIQRAQEKLKRDLKISIGEEINKGLQGLFGIIQEAQGHQSDGQPLSQRLRKRKLNSA